MTVGREESRAPPAARALRHGVGFGLRTLGMLPVLIIVCIVFYLLNERFFSLQNISIVAQQASINIVLAAGMTFVILTAGIDLSVGSILAASAMVALVVSKIPGWEGFGWLGLPAGLLTGLACGAINGALIAGLRLPPFIVTLGTLTAVRGFARLLGQDKTVINTELPFAYVGSGTLFGVPFLVVIAAATIVVSWFILRRTVLGIYVYSVGGNLSGARLAGIRVWAILLFVYGFSGLCAGLGGVMSAGRLYAANGIQLGQSYELDAIAAVILGGTSFVGGIGSIWGTLIGALIIAVMSNGLILTGVPDVWQYIVKGLVIIGAVTLDRFRQSEGGHT
ncbi:MAG: ribose ABC transporter permease [Bauldia sp.]